MGCGQGQRSTGVTGALRHKSIEVNVVTGIATSRSGHCQHDGFKKPGGRFASCFRESVTKERHHNWKVSGKYDLRCEVFMK